MDGAAPKPSSAAALEAAYALETPDDNRRLYRSWASTYDQDFIDATGYVYARHVAEVFDRHADPDADDPVLDIGCGTGGVGVALRALHRGPVDGIDISPEMMEVAATKQTADGEPVYRSLREADLTARVPIEDGACSAIVSAGTFTFGHLGPGPLDEVLRIAASGALLVIGVNADHYRADGFADRFDDDVATGAITSPTIVEVPVYSGDVGDHSDSRAMIAVFHRT